MVFNLFSYYSINLHEQAGVSTTHKVSVMHLIELELNTTEFKYSLLFISCITEFVWSDNSIKFN